MKLLAYLKISIKGIIRELPAIMLSYAIYPMILALILGYTQQTSFSPIVNQPIFSISVVDEDISKDSNALVSFLKSENISKLIEIEESAESSDYSLTIPKGYSLSINREEGSEEAADIIVEASEDASTSKGNMLVNLIDSYNKEQSKNLLIEENIEERDIDKEEISNILASLYNTSSIENEKHMGEKTLTSYQYFSVSFLTFVFILFIIAIITSESMGKEIGLYNRIMSTGLTKIEYFNLEFASNYMMMLVINFVYVFAFRLFNLSFRGSIPILILIILIQSLVITLLGSLISNLFGKKYGMIVAQIYLMFHIVFGGGMGNPELFSNIAVFRFFTRYKPDILISDTYRNFLIYNDLSSISQYLYMMIGFSVFVYLINIIAADREWGIK